MPMPLLPAPLLARLLRGRRWPCPSGSTERTNLLFLRRPRVMYDNQRFLPRKRYHICSRVFQGPPGSGVAQDDEAAAIAAMFQAQDASWGETQEKMSQSVSAPRGRFRLSCIFFDSNASPLVVPLFSGTFIQCDVHSSRPRRSASHGWAKPSAAPATAATATLGPAPTTELRVLPMRPEGWAPFYFDIFASNVLFQAIGSRTAPRTTTGSTIIARA
jgi:hypothetical protein